MKHEQKLQWWKNFKQKRMLHVYQQAAKKNQPPFGLL